MNINSPSNSTTQADSPESQHFGFWGSLPLSRKLLLAFGILFVFAVVIAVVTLQGLNRTQAAYDDTLNQGVEVRRLSTQLTISLLQARRDEKNFLLRWREQGFDTAYANYVTLNKQDVANMREYLNQLAPFRNEAPTASKDPITQGEYDADIAALAENINIYEQSFNAIVGSYQKRGYDENTGFEGEFRTLIKSVEDQIFGKAGLEPLEISLLQIRRNEKDYLARLDLQYIENIRILVPQLKAQIAVVEQLEPALKTKLGTQLDDYLATIDGLVALDQEIVTQNDNLITSGRAVEPLALKLESLGATLAADDISAAHANSTQTFTFSIITVLVVLMIAIALAVFISRQITRPIGLLTETAQQISEGNFETQAEVASADEIGALAKTFNIMTGRLGQAFEDVRRRSLAVQTSAEVSRRLSMATNPRQLAVEVVEQVQAAFHYYHAHIYFLDEESGDLLMAGGTGEAGAKLLASGHRVPKGRGLVGRAAATNAPVLVPDVSKAIGWLPNALLPDTKSEAAIPISSGKHVLGVIDVQQNIVNGLGEEDVSLLQSLASQVAISLQNARSFDESRIKADLETMVNAIGQKIQRTSTVEDTLQTAIREVGLALGASRVSVNIQSSRENDKASGN